MGTNFTIKTCCNNYNNCNLAKNSESSGNSLSGGAVAGIVVGSVAGVGILGGAGAFTAYKIKSKKKSDE
jgi:hypothetical protein